MIWFNVLLFLAILPSSFLMYSILKLDKVEREPFKLVVMVFLFGCLSCIPAGLIEAFAEAIGERIFMSEAAFNMYMFLFVVPFTEEGVKYLSMSTIRKRPEFNFTFDGVVYGVAASLGFATLENLVYVLGSSYIGTAVVRGVLSVPLHCVCGVFMGYYYGLAHRYRTLGLQKEGRTYYALAYFIPAIIHGLYDYSLSLESDFALVVGLAFTLVCFFLAFKRVRLSSAEDTPFWGGQAQLTYRAQPQYTQNPYPQMTYGQQQIQVQPAQQQTMQVPVQYGQQQMPPQFAQQVPTQYVQQQPQVQMPAQPQVPPQVQAQPQVPTQVQAQAQAPTQVQVPAQPQTPPQAQPQSQLQPQAPMESQPQPQPQSGELSESPKQEDTATEYSQKGIRL